MLPSDRLFRARLPPNYVIPNTGVSVNHAVDYVQKVRDRFRGQPEVYKQFLDILNCFRMKIPRGPQESRRNELLVYQQITHLFRHHADLCQEFIKFLPDPKVIEMNNTNRAHSAGSSVRPGKFRLK